MVVGNRSVPIDSVELINGASVRPEVVQWLRHGFLACGKSAPAGWCTRYRRDYDCTGAGRNDIPRLDTGLMAMDADMTHIRLVGEQNTSEGKLPLDSVRNMPVLLRAIIGSGEVDLLLVAPLVSASANWQALSNRLKIDVGFYRISCQSGNTA